MIVVFAPGGTSDIVARVTARYLSDSFGRQVLVDNRPGAGGNIGATLAAQAQPTVTRCSQPFLDLPSTRASTRSSNTIR